MLWLYLAISKVKLWDIAANLVQCLYQRGKLNNNHENIYKKKKQKKSVTVIKKKKKNRAHCKTWTLCIFECVNKNCQMDLLVFHKEKPYMEILQYLQDYWIKYKLSKLNFWRKNLTIDLKTHYWIVVMLNSHMMIINNNYWSNYWFMTICHIILPAVTLPTLLYFLASTC